MPSLAVSSTTIYSPLKRYRRSVLTLVVLLCVKCIVAQPGRSLFPEFQKKYTEVPNLIAVDSAYLMKYWRVLFFDTINYQFLVSKTSINNMQVLGHNVAEIFVHHDSTQTIDKIVYVLKISNSSLLDSLKENISSNYMFSSINKKLLSDFSVVKSVYFWDYKIANTVLLTFCTKSDLDVLYREYGTELAVIEVYRKATTPPLPN